MSRGKYVLTSWLEQSALAAIRANISTWTESKRRVRGPWALDRITTWQVGREMRANMQFDDR